VLDSGILSPPPEVPLLLRGTSNHALLEEDKGQGLLEEEGCLLQQYFFVKLRNTLVSRGYPWDLKAPSPKQK